MLYKYWMQGLVHDMVFLERVSPPDEIARLEFLFNVRIALPPLCL